LEGINTQRELTPCGLAAPLELGRLLQIRGRWPETCKLRTAEEERIRFPHCPLDRCARYTIRLPPS